MKAFIDLNNDNERFADKTPFLRPGGPVFDENGNVVGNIVSCKKIKNGHELDVCVDEAFIEKIKKKEVFAIRDIFLNRNISVDVEMNSE